jgi:hypothetical protein
MICFLCRMQSQAVVQASTQPVDIREKGRVVLAGAKVPPGAQSQASSGGTPS